MAGVRSKVCVFKPFNYVTGVTILSEPNGKTEPFTAYAVVICPEPDISFMSRKHKARLESYHTRSQKCALYMTQHLFLPSQPSDICFAEITITLCC